ncbi:MAG: hypothetical protein HYZ53_13225 [Planctomycetes bacterium]|nr:hypothetical protein [Planctomycetota bacterium]
MASDRLRRTHREPGCLALLLSLPLLGLGFLALCDLSAWGDLPHVKAFLLGLGLLLLGVVVRVTTRDRASAWLLLGLGCAFVFLGEVIREHWRGKSALETRLFLFGFGSVALGASLLRFSPWLALWRTGVVLDRRKRTAVTWSGLLFPFRSRSQDLAPSATIALSGPDKEGLFLISVASPGRSTDWCRLPGASDARVEAERVAAFLGLPLRDTTQGLDVTRPPDRLNESFRDRFRRARGRVEIPETPPGIGRWSQVGDRRLELHTPPLGISPALLTRLWWGTVFPVALVCVAPFVLASAAPSWSRWLGWSLGTAGVPYVLVLLTSLGPRARSRTRVVVTPERLRLERPGLFGRSVQEFPIAEIEEVSLLDAMNLAPGEGRGHESSTSPGDMPPTGSWSWWRSPAAGGWAPLLLLVPFPFNVLVWLPVGIVVFVVAQVFLPAARQFPLPKAWRQALEERWLDLVRLCRRMTLTDSEPRSHAVIQVRGDRRWARFGGDLRVEEARWIHAHMIRILTSEDGA